MRDESYSFIWQPWVFIYSFLCVADVLMCASVSLSAWCIDIMLKSDYRGCRTVFTALFVGDYLSLRALFFRYDGIILEQVIYY